MTLIQNAPGGTPISLPEKRGADGPYQNTDLPRASANPTSFVGSSHAASHVTTLSILSFPGSRQNEVESLTANPCADARYAAWFSELDAWTEYWDIYHPETRGRFYFGNGQSEDGLLTRFLPRERRPPAFTAWCHMATGCGSRDDFTRQVRLPEVAAAVMEVDGLVGQLFENYFGDPADPAVRADYLEAMFRFGADLLPPATEREARVPDGDPRKRTAGRHAIDGDIMWFAWALELEAAYAIAGSDRNHARRALQIAGVAIGCPANFAWRGHRYTRPEYQADENTEILLRQRGLAWATDFEAAAEEIHTLYRIREWGHE